MRPRSKLSIAGSAVLEGKAANRLDDVIDHLVGQPRKDAEPECPVRDQVGIAGIARDAVVDALECRLADEVSAEQEARSDLRLVEVDDQLTPAESRVRLDRQREAEPARLRVGSCPWEHEAIEVGEA